MSSLQQSIAEANRLRGRSNQKKRAEYFGKKHDWELMVDMLCDREENCWQIWARIEILVSR